MVELATLAPAAAPPRATPWQRTVRTFTLLLTVVAAGLVVWTIAADLQRKRQLERDAREASRAKAVEAATAIDAELKAAEPLVAALVNDLSSGRLKTTDIVARISADLAAHENLFEVGVAYTPFATGPAVKLFAPHVARLNRRANPFQLETRYDYTTYDWYKDALQHPGWGEPYFGGATQTLVVGYALPFFRPGDETKTPLGVARANVSLDHVRQLVSRTSLGQTGYGFLFSRKGMLLSYPEERYVREQKNAMDLAAVAKDAARRDLTARALAGEPSEGMSVSAMTGQAVWLVHQPIPSMKWVLGLASFTDEVSLDVRDVRRSYVQILCASMLFLFGASLVGFRIERAEHGRLWNAVVASAILLAGGITMLWWLTLRYPDRNAEESVHILDEIGLQKFLNVENRAPGAIEPVRVRTGLLVRTARFIDSNDVVVTGRVWQRIPFASREQVPAGVEMPDAESFTLRDAQTIRQGDDELSSWTFSATVREPSDWSIKYPFDRVLMRLRLLPRSGAVPVVLVPDLQAYELLVPAALPGVEGTIILPGWEIDHSYYSYVRQSLSTTASTPTAQDRTLGHDLAFNIVAERRFLNPFVSSVLPVIVILCLLFGLIIIGSKESKKVAATGFKATDILRASATLLFPALIAQVNMRSKIDANQIIYIEYLYFVLYLAILGVAANAVLFTLKTDGFAQVRDNLIPKLIFWPIILGACFGVSLVFLY